MTENEMLGEVLSNQRELRGELGGYRTDLQKHIKAASDQALCMQRQLSSIREDMASLASTEDVIQLKDRVTINKVRLSLIYTGIGVSLTGVFGLWLTYLGKVI